MATGQEEMTEKQREEFRNALLYGESNDAVSIGLFRLYRRFMRRLPSDPRGAMCYNPFAGIGGRILSLQGFQPSRKNPRFCKSCFEKFPAGGVEIEIGVLFADVRGFTSLAEATSPEEIAALLNRFYAASTHTLSHADAVIDKLVGDEVMALFVPGFAGHDFLRKMVLAAEELLRSVGYGSGNEPWLPVGIGLDFGPAYVGNVGPSEVKDFTALGDAVNTAARLQGKAAEGTIVMSSRVYDSVSDLYPDADPVELSLKGKAEPVSARIVSFAR